MVLQGFSSIRAPRHPRRPLCDLQTINHPRKVQRRREYARVQTLFKKSMSRAAKEIMDGVNESRIPSLAEMQAYWKPILTRESTPYPPQERHPDQAYVWHLITCEDTATVNVEPSSAPGIDGITPAQWRSVSASVKALFLNLVLAMGSFQSQLLVNRTVFLPRKASSETPADISRTRARGKSCRRQAAMP